MSSVSVPRRSRVIAAAIAGSAVVALTLQPSSPAPSGVPAGRVTIALVGDSIVEGAGAMARSGLAAALRQRLVTAGYAAGGLGFVPAHPAGVGPVRVGATQAAPWSYRGTWRYLGVSPFDERREPACTTTSAYGADGRAAVTDQTGATAAAWMRGDRFGALYVRGPDAGRLRFAVDGRARTLSARVGRPDGAAVAWITAPPGIRHRVSVRSLGGGTLTFTGLIARSDVRGTATQVEVSALGRSCGQAAEAFGPLQREAMATLRASVTVLMFGTNEQPTVATDATRRAFVTGIVRRAAIARRAGGRCVVVPPAPNPRSAAAQAEVRRLSRQAARAGRCRYVDAFRGLWHPTGSEAAGLTTDGIHPTPGGYRLMAERLAIVLLPLLPAARAEASGGRR